MNEIILDAILDIIKWEIIIVIGAIAFYIVAPKYHSVGGNPHNRINKITGKVEVISEGTWKSIDGYTRDE